MEQGFATIQYLNCADERKFNHKCFLGFLSLCGVVVTVAMLAVL